VKADDAEAADAAAVLQLAGQSADTPAGTALAQPNPAHGTLSGTWKVNETRGRKGKKKQSTNHDNEEQEQREAEQHAGEDPSDIDPSTPAAKARRKKAEKKAKKQAQKAARDQAKREGKRKRT
jgi:hypothetical protein